jgi:hypothetical protein
MHGLRLAEHGRGVERRAPRAGEQLGRAEEDGGALFPRRAVPVLPGVGGALIACSTCVALPLCTVARTCLRSCGHHGLERLAAADLLAADDERELDLVERICSRRTRSSSRSGDPGA